MPFDENFHYGLVKLHAEQVSPIITSQPPSADGFGIVANDSSFLYHYLLSLPFRLVESISPQLQAHVYSLRAINIALGALTLYLVVRIGRRCGLAGLWAYAPAFILAVTPVFYDLAAHINYDNLMLPLSLLAIMLAIDVAKAAWRGRLAMVRLLLLTMVLMTASLVKYSFLPIGFAVALFTLIVVWRGIGLRNTVKSASKQVKNWSWSRRAALAAPLLVLVGLCAHLYGSDIVRYGTPHPQCHVVLSVERCMQYGPWARNYQLYQTRQDRQPTENQLVPYSIFWVRTVYEQVFSRVSATSDGIAYTPNAAVRNSVETIFIIGLIGALFTARRVFRLNRLPVLLFACVAVVYGLALWGQNYSDYTNLNAAVAVQGRYALPVVPLLYVVIIVFYMTTIRRISRSYVNYSRRQVLTWLALNRYL